MRAIAQKGGCRWNERKEEEEHIVIPNQLAVGALDAVEKLVMMDPENGDDQEADDEAEELRCEGREGIGKLARTWIGAEGWQLHIEDHDGDDDGEDAVTEGFKATGLWLEFNTTHRVILLSMALVWIFRISHQPLEEPKRPGCGDEQGCEVSDMSGGYRPAAS